MFSARLFVLRRRIIVTTLTFGIFSVLLKNNSRPIEHSGWHKPSSGMYTAPITITVHRQYFQTVSVKQIVNLFIIYACPPRGTIHTHFHMDIIK